MASTLEQLAELCTARDFYKSFLSRLAEQDQAQFVVDFKTVFTTLVGRQLTKRQKDVSSLTASQIEGILTKIEQFAVGKASAIEILTATKEAIASFFKETFGEAPPSPKKAPDSPANSAVPESPLSSPKNAPASPQSEMKAGQVFPEVKDVTSEILKFLNIYDAKKKEFDSIPQQAQDPSNVKGRLEDDMKSALKNARQIFNQLAQNQNIQLTVDQLNTLWGNGKSITNVEGFAASLSSAYEQAQINKSIPKLSNFFTYLHTFINKLRDKSPILATKVSSIYREGIRSPKKSANVVDIINEDSQLDNLQKKQLITEFLELSNETLVLNNTVFQTEIGNLGKLIHLGKDFRLLPHLLKTIKDKKLEDNFWKIHGDPIDLINRFALKVRNGELEPALFLQVTTIIYESKLFKDVNLLPILSAISGDDLAANLFRTAVVNKLLKEKLSLDQEKELTRLCGTNKEIREIFLLKNLKGLDNQVLQNLINILIAAYSGSNQAVDRPAINNKIILALQVLDISTGSKIIIRACKDAKDWLFDLLAQGQLPLHLLEDKNLRQTIRNAFSTVEWIRLTNHLQNGAEQNLAVMDKLNHQEEPVRTESKRSGDVVQRTVSEPIPGRSDKQLSQVDREGVLASFRQQLGTLEIYIQTSQAALEEKSTDQRDDIKLLLVVQLIAGASLVEMNNSRKEEALKYLKELVDAGKIPLEIRNQILAQVHGEFGIKCWKALMGQEIKADDLNHLLQQVFDKKFTRPAQAQKVKQTMVQAIFSDGFEHLRNNVNADNLFRMAVDLHAEQTEKEFFNIIIDLLGNAIKVNKINPQSVSSVLIHHPVESERLSSLIRVIDFPNVYEICLQHKDKDSKDKLAINLINKSDFVIHNLDKIDELLKIIGPDKAFNIVKLAQNNHKEILAAHILQTANDDAFKLSNEQIQVCAKNLNIEIIYQIYRNQQSPQIKEMLVTEMLQRPEDLKKLPVDILLNLCKEASIDNKSGLIEIYAEVIQATEASYDDFINLCTNLPNNISLLPNSNRLLNMILGNVDQFYEITPDTLTSLLRHASDLNVCLDRYRATIQSSQNTIVSKMTLEQKAQAAQVKVEDHLISILNSLKKVFQLSDSEDRQIAMESPFIAMGAIKKGINRSEFDNQIIKIRKDLQPFSKLINSFGDLSYLDVDTTNAYLELASFLWTDGSQYTQLKDRIEHDRNHILTSLLAQLKSIPKEQPLDEKSIQTSIEEDGLNPEDEDLDLEDEDRVETASDFLTTIFNLLQAQERPNDYKNILLVINKIRKDISPQMRMNNIDDIARLKPETRQACLQLAGLLWDRQYSNGFVYAQLNDRLTGIAEEQAKIESVEKARSVLVQAALSDLYSFASKESGIRLQTIQTTAEALEPIFKAATVIDQIKSADRLFEQQAKETTSLVKQLGYLQALLKHYKDNVEGLNEFLTKIKPATKEHILEIYRTHKVNIDIPQEIDLELEFTLYAKDEGTIQQRVKVVLEEKSGVISDDQRVAEARYLFTTPEILQYITDDEVTRLQAIILRKERDKNKGQLALLQNLQTNIVRDQRSDPNKPYLKTITERSVKYMDVFDHEQKRNAEPLNLLPAFSMTTVQHGIMFKTPNLRNKHISNILEEKTDVDQIKAKLMNYETHDLIDLVLGYMRKNKKHDAAKLLRAMFSDVKHCMPMLTDRVFAQFQQDSAVRISMKEFIDEANSIQDNAARQIRLYALTSQHVETGQLSSEALTQLIKSIPDITLDEWKKVRAEFRKAFVASNASGFDMAGIKKILKIWVGNNIVSANDVSKLIIDNPQSKRLADVLLNLYLDNKEKFVLTNENKAALMKSVLIQENQGRLEFSEVTKKLYSTSALTHEFLKFIPDLLGNENDTTGLWGLKKDQKREFFESFIAQPELMKSTALTKEGFKDFCRLAAQWGVSVNYYNAQAKDHPHQLFLHGTSDFLLNYSASRPEVKGQEVPDQKKENEATTALIDRFMDSPGLSLPLQANGNEAEMCQDFCRLGQAKNVDVQKAFIKAVLSRPYWFAYVATEKPEKLQPAQQAIKVANISPETLAIALAKTRNYCTPQQQKNIASLLGGNDLSVASVTESDMRILAGRYTDPDTKKDIVLRLYQQAIRSEEARSKSFWPKRKDQAEVYFEKFTERSIAMATKPLQSIKFDAIFRLDNQKPQLAYLRDTSWEEANADEQGFWRPMENRKNISSATRVGQYQQAKVGKKGLIDRYFGGQSGMKVITDYQDAANKLSDAFVANESKRSGSATQIGESILRQSLDSLKAIDATLKAKQPWSMNLFFPRTFNPFMSSNVELGFVVDTRATCIVRQAEICMEAARRVEHLSPDAKALLNSSISSLRKDFIKQRPSVFTAWAGDKMEVLYNAYKDAIDILNQAEKQLDQQSKNAQRQTQALAAEEKRRPVESGSYRSINLVMNSQLTTQPVPTLPEVKASDISTVSSTSTQPAVIAFGGMGAIVRTAGQYRQTAETSSRSSQVVTEITQENAKNITACIRDYLTKHGPKLYRANEFVEFESLANRFNPAKSSEAKTDQDRIAVQKSDMAMVRQELQGSAPNDRLRDDNNIRKILNLLPLYKELKKPYPAYEIVKQCYQEINDDYLKNSNRYSTKWGLAKAYKDLLVNIGDMIGCKFATNRYDYDRLYKVDEQDQGLTRSPSQAHRI